MISDDLGRPTTMTVKQATPYLFFDGQAKDAIALYQRTLGAKVEGLMTYAQMPEEAGVCTPVDRERIMHALLHIDAARVMVSDRTSEQPTKDNSNVHIVLDFTDVEDMTKKFDALASTGSVHMPIHDAFWEDKFGGLQDEFGVNWMFICSSSANT